MTILLFIALLIIVFCIYFRKPRPRRLPRPYYPRPDHKPSNSATWIVLALLAVVAYSFLKTEETKESTAPTSTEPERVTQQKEEPTPLWMQPPPGVTLRAPPSPLWLPGYGPFDPPQPNSPWNKK